MQLDFENFQPFQTFPRKFVIFAIKI